MTNETQSKSTTQPEAGLKIRANSVYAHRVLGGVHEWIFPSIGQFTVDPDRISASARAFLLNYGITQWVNDGAAVNAGPNGKTNPAEKYNGARERAELLNSGTEASGLLRRGAGAGQFSLVTRALVRLGTYGGKDVSTYDLANKFVKDLAESTDPKFEKLAFKGQVGKVRAWLEKASPKIAAAIEAIKAEESAGVDTTISADDLLDEME